MAPWVRRDVARSLVLTVADSGEERRLNELLDKAPSNQPLAPFAPPPPGDLSPRASAVWHLLANRDADRFAALYESLGSHALASLDGLSPLLDANRLSAPVLLIAPDDDFAFPAGEATLLHTARPDLVQVTRTSALDHVTPAFGPRLMIGYWELWRFASRATALMAEA